MNVSNRKCIRRLSVKTIKSAKKRNIIAVLAIALTAILFTTIMTIAFSINYSFQQSNFRQAGGYSHGTFKYLTEEQFNELKDDPLIKEYGTRRFVGMPDKEPFNKSHVEIGYSDANNAKWMFLDPIEGRFPAEGTNEAATDTRVLSLLGIEPKLGEEFTLTFDVDGKETTETFTLSGWWDYDEAIVANHVLIPESRADEIFEKLGTTGQDGMTGLYNMDIMFSSSMNIQDNIDKVLKNHGFQSESRSLGDNYISTGVNWGYTGAQLANDMDFITVALIAALLLLIIFTGYLIIYNVFQISVVNDIRFYGLLKTIGTTGRQLSRIIRIQAMWLSVIGIPIGLIAGYGIGAALTPIVISRLDGIPVEGLSASPLIFIVSALFALITVLISCRKPGKMAAKVSPIEAIRYSEGLKGNKAVRKSKKGASLFAMAMANLGRNRVRTTITIISLTLAVVLLNLTVTFTNGFNMDKYVSRQIATDFIVADAKHFQTGGFWSFDQALPKEIINEVNTRADITGGGLTYGEASDIQEFVTEEYYRDVHGRWNDEQTLDWLIDRADKNSDGKLADSVQLFGMESWVLDRLTVLEGDISKLYEPGTRYIAAVYGSDDYGKPYMDSHWAKVGDKVTLRYVDEREYYNTDTGEILNPDSIPDDINYSSRITRYHDVEYEVAVLVNVPHSLSYRYYGADEFVLNDQTFIQDTGTENILYYAFNTTDETEGNMEKFLSDFTKNQMPQFDYDSKATFAAEFESFRSMFIILGGVLSLIIGIVGILNFLNAILTGIITRRREFAVLQSVGMTGNQLKTMLVFEGLCYAAGSIIASLILSLITGPVMSSVFESMFWFFSYKFTIAPVLAVAPIFILLGIIMPLITYKSASKHSIVERLSETE